LNLASASSAHDKATLWGFIARTVPDATPATHPLLDRLAGYAVAYFEDFVLPAKQYRAASEKERAAFAELRARLAALDPGMRDETLIQNEVYAVGNAHGFEPLRSWFQGLYEVLLGQSQGPRFGSFAAIYGVPETIALIDQALAGELASA
jgi:lysyl-tRNA synthetase class 1